MDTQDAAERRQNWEVRGVKHRNLSRRSRDLDLELDLCLLCPQPKVIKYLKRPFAGNCCRYNIRLHLHLYSRRLSAETSLCIAVVMWETDWSTAVTSNSRPKTDLRPNTSAGSPLHRRCLTVHHWPRVYDTGPE